MFISYRANLLAHGHLSFNHRQLPGDESDEADRLSVSTHFVDPDLLV
jgi:hypothetical protein